MYPTLIVHTTRSYAFILYAVHQVTISHHFMSSFYARRSQKRKTDSQVKQLFALLGSASVKVARKHVGEIDSTCRRRHFIIVHKRLSFGRMSWKRFVKIKFLMGIFKLFQNSRGKKVVNIEKFEVAMWEGRASKRPSSKIPRPYF